MRRAIIVMLGVLGCGGGGGDPTSTPDAATVADAAVDAPAEVPVCGDGRCSPAETAMSCCGDCGVCQDEAVVTVATGVPGGTTGTSVTPGGMAASYSDFTGGPFAEMEFPIEVAEEPIASATYFWAQTFYFGTTDQTGYTGLQSGSRCGGGAAGKRAIFSIWDATAAVPGPGASCEKFGGEGVGYHCCAAFGWRTGVAYRFKVREVSPTRWELAIHDPTTASDRVLGTITASAGYGRLAGNTTGFTEYYTQVDACETTPYARARFYRPSADGTPAARVSAITYGTCMPQATATCAGAACQ